MQSIDVLVRIDRPDHPRLVHVRGQGELHEDPVHALVGVELVEQLEHLALGRRLWETVVSRGDPGLRGGIVFPPDVDVGRRVVADEDRRETDGRAERLDLARDLVPNLLGERLSVDPDRRHRRIP